MLIAVLAAVGMLYSDLHFGMLKPLRQGLSMVLYPIEQLLILPRDIALWLGRYGAVVSDVASQRVSLERKEVEYSESLLQTEQLRLENESLRALLPLRPQARRLSWSSSHDPGSRSASARTRTRS